MDKTHRHTCLYLYVYVFEVLPMVVITFNRSFLSIFDYFFRIQLALSLSHCAPNLAFISVQFSFPIIHGSLWLCELLLHFFLIFYLFVCSIWADTQKNRSKVNFEILLWLNMVPTYNLDLSFNLKILFVREKKRFVAGSFHQFVCIKLLNYKKCDASMVAEKFDLNEWKYSFISIFLLLFKQNYIDT